MRRRVDVAVELDDDRARVDPVAVHRYLSELSYWARGRSLSETRRLIREASYVVGLYDGDRQIGFARVVSDATSFAYLADVYVLEDWRGRGLGVELVRAAVDTGPFAAVRWILHTLDAHDLYRKFGFGEPGDRLMERGPR